MRLTAVAEAVSRGRRKGQPIRDTVPSPHEKWTERPLAVVVLREGSSASAEELRAFLAERVPKWWLPERFEFIDAIPKTAVGKFKKTALRERFAAQSGA